MYVCIYVPEPQRSFTAFTIKDLTSASLQSSFMDSNASSANSCKSAALTLLTLAACKDFHDIAQTLIS